VAERRVRTLSRCLMLWMCVCACAADISRGRRMSTGRAVVTEYQRSRPDLLNHPSTSTSQHGPTESFHSDAVEAGQTEQPAAEETDGEGQADGELVDGRGSKAGGSARRKAGSCRLGFQYPDVFGRRRARGGSMAAAGRRRAITSGRINFRRRTAQAQRDDVTSADDGSRLEVSKLQYTVLIQLVALF